MEAETGACYCQVIAVLNEVTQTLRRELFLPVRYMGAVGFAVSVCDTPSGPLIVVETGRGVIYAGPDEIGPVDCRRMREGG